MKENLRPLQQVLEKNCGKTFAQITPRTPLINRSDGVLFHLTLFAGPAPRPKSSGGFYSRQAVCYFAYAHVQLGPKNHTISVVITHTKEEPEEVHRQVEDAADKLAELIGRGDKPATIYTFNGRELISGFPD